MKLEIQLKQDGFFFDNLERFNEVKSKENEFPDIVVYTDRTRGIKSNFINIQIKNGDVDNDETAPHISCELNRNQAMQIKKALEAFIEEIENDE